MGDLKRQVGFFSVKKVKSCARFVVTSDRIGIMFLLCSTTCSEFASISFVWINFISLTKKVLLEIRSVKLPICKLSKIRFDPWRRLKNRRFLLTSLVVNGRKLSTENHRCLNTNQLMIGVNKSKFLNILQKIELSCSS